ncbi:hypothetical protein BGM25_06250 [Bacillus sp. FJAT-29953]|nr:hypothetical protein [Bacillus sp. FJAT-29953]
MAVVSKNGKVVIETELAPHFPDYAEKVLKIAPVAHPGSPNMYRKGYSTKYENIMPWHDIKALNNEGAMRWEAKVNQQLENRRLNAKHIEEIAELKDLRLIEKLSLGLIRYEQQH